MFGFIPLFSQDHRLLNICFSIEACFFKSNDGYLKLTPTNFDPNVYNYTMHIPKNYPGYATTGPMTVDFYVVLNLTEIDDSNYDKRSSAICFLVNTFGKLLAYSDTASYPSDIVLIYAKLWQPTDRVPLFDTEDEVLTKLIVHQTYDGIITKSDPYFLKFKRNE